MVAPRGVGTRVGRGSVAPADPAPMIRTVRYSVETGTLASAGTAPLPEATLGMAEYPM
jgi:hypothetical protein